MRACVFMVVEIWIFEPYGLNNKGYGDAEESGVSKD